LIKYSNRVHKIIAVSDAIRRILIEDGIDPDHIVTIRSGFVPGRFEKKENTIDLREKLGFSNDTAVICTVAALAPHKAHQILLKAAWIVIQKYPDVKFIFAGEGETRPSIERNIANLGLEKSVILLGFVEDVGAVYRASDIFALSSEEEGLCTSILDAMYFGLPIVATRAGGIPELVRDGINGFIVPVNDHVSFAERLNVLIEDKNKGKIMGLRSSEVLEQNTIQNTIEKTLAVYRELWNTLS
jgi:glycosyltransferase involved in cell wall biosynthesis